MRQELIASTRIACNGIATGTSPRSETKTKLLGKPRKGRRRSPGAGGKSRRDSSSSSERSSGLGKGLCFNCGKPGHVKKDCPEPKKAASGSPKSKPPVCFNCGKPGHLKKDCPQRTRRLADGPEDESEDYASGEEESHLAMAMLTEQSERGVNAVGSGTELEYLNRVPDARGEVGSPWLVDSGATSHILSRKFMSKYRILKRHAGKVDLFAANDELIANDGMMDVEVRLRTEVGERRVVRKFVLQRCLVADISFNVLSPFCLGKNGWKTGSERSSHLVREELLGVNLLRYRCACMIARGGFMRCWTMEVDTVRNPPGIQGLKPRSGTHERGERGEAGGVEDSRSGIPHLLVARKHRVKRLRNNLIHLGAWRLECPSVLLRAMERILTWKGWILR